MNLETSYTGVRLQRGTHARLQAFLDRLKLKAKANPSKFRPALTAGKIGLGDAIDELLYIVDREEMRKSSYSRSKKKAEKINPAQPLLFDMDRLADDGCPNIH